MSSASETPFVVRLPNWVGDVCMALPAIALLRSAGLPLHLVGKGWAADLLAGHGLPCTALPKGLRAGARVLRGLGAREGLLFTNSFGSALQARLAGIRASGYRREFRALLLGRGQRRERGLHEVEVFWRLAAGELRARGLPAPDAPPPQLGLVLDESHRRQARAALANAGVAGAYTVLCPLAVGTAAGASKVWPSFPLLSRMLHDAGETLVACPGPGEDDDCARALPGARIVPGLGLGAYAAVLAGARRAIANDSGPMHLAAAVATPVIGVFGATDPRRTRPWSPRGLAIGRSGRWPSPAAVLAAWPEGCAP